MPHVVPRQPIADSAFDRNRDRSLHERRRFEPLGQPARVADIKPLLELDLARLTGFEIHSSACDFDAVNRQRDADVRQRLIARMPHGREEDGGRLRIRDTVLQMKVSDPDVLNPLGRDAENLHVLEFGQLLLRRAAFPESFLLIADEHDPLQLQFRDLPSRLCRELQTDRSSTNAINDGDSIQRRSRIGLVAVSVPGSRFVGAAQRDEMNLAAGR